MEVSVVGVSVVVVEGSVVVVDVSVVVDVVVVEPHVQAIVESLHVGDPSQYLQ